MIDAMEKDPTPAVVKKRAPALPLVPLNYEDEEELTPEQRTQQLTALQQEAITRVTPLLGNSNRLTAYKQYGGSWIDSLVPRPQPKQ